jgi:GT2 family glycosyltransferase
VGAASRTTVVVATRNRAGELARTLTRLAELDPAPPVVVVDNASTDDTAATAAAFDRVTLVRLSHNAGAAGRNAGVEHVRTPFVAFSDDDSWWAADALPRAEQVLAAHPRVGLLAAATLVGPDEVPDPVNAALRASPLTPVPDAPGPPVLGFLACAAIVRTCAFRQVGGFSTLLRFGAEETLLAYDLAAHGWLLCHREDVRAHHHPSSHRMDADERRALEERNRLLIACLRRPARVALRAWAGAAGAAVRDRPSRRALTGALRLLDPALCRRHPVPAHVEREIRLLEEAG